MCNGVNSGGISQRRITLLARLFSLLPALIFGFASAVLGQQAEPPVIFTEPLSPRTASYLIRVELEPSTGLLTADEVLTFWNRIESPVSELQIHLYLNAFRNTESTFMRERGSIPEAMGWGFIEIGKVELASSPLHQMTGEPGLWRDAFPLNSSLSGSQDLTDQLEFIHPDDDNDQDRTVARIPLPAALSPGQGVQFHLRFTARLPTPPIARTGFLKEYFFAGQWFPKLGVLEDEGWNCHQYHALSEFFADFGVYDVMISLPPEYIVGATGSLVGVTEGDGLATHQYHAEDVHDFAWTASTDYRVFEGETEDVRVRALVQPDHSGQGERYVEAAKVAIRYFQDHYGDYPFPNLTVVDPRRGAMSTGGMEYPTLITGETFYGLPEGVRLLELVTIHEFGHNFWYHLLASNEFEDSWMDEGINTYSEIELFDEVYGYAIDFLGLRIRNSTTHRIRFLSLPDADPISRPSWEYMNGLSYSINSYSRPGLALVTLRNLIGSGNMKQVLRTYYSRWRFKHPKPRDFFLIVDEAAGRDMSWFIDQAFRSTAVLDYGIDLVGSVEEEKSGIDIDLDLDTFLADPSAIENAEPRKDGEGDKEYRSTVRARRYGEFRFPVEVEVVFENGERFREHWDGEARWKEFVYRKATRVVSATVDPDNRIPLDINLTNNGRMRDPDRTGIDRISTRWMFLVQLALDLVNLF